VDWICVAPNRNEILQSEDMVITVFKKNLLNLSLAIHVRHWLGAQLVKYRSSNSNLLTVLTSYNKQTSILRYRINPHAQNTTVLDSKIFLTKIYRLLVKRHTER
jgi:hypothetical protein